MHGPHTPLRLSPSGFGWNLASDDDVKAAVVTYLYSQEEIPPVAMAEVGQVGRLH